LDLKKKNGLQKQYGGVGSSSFLLLSEGFNAVKRNQALHQMGDWGGGWGGSDGKFFLKEERKVPRTDESNGKEETRSNPNNPAHQALSRPPREVSRQGAAGSVQMLQAGLRRPSGSRGAG
jgi:hypothetical protein